MKMGESRPPTRKTVAWTRLVAGGCLLVALLAIPLAATALYYFPQHLRLGNRGLFLGGVRPTRSVVPRGVHWLSTPRASGLSIKFSQNAYMVVFIRYDR